MVKPVSSSISIGINISLMIVKFQQYYILMLDSWTSSTIVVESVETHQFDIVNYIGRSQCLLIRIIYSNKNYQMSSEIQHITSIHIILNVFRIVCLLLEYTFSFSILTYFRFLFLWQMLFPCTICKNCKHLYFHITTVTGILKQMIPTSP